jgi:hypothetical protein
MLQGFLLLLRISLQDERGLKHWLLFYLSVSFLQTLKQADGDNWLESRAEKCEAKEQAMIYMRLFTILLAASFMMIVFYSDLATVTSLLAGLCGGFVAVVAAQNNTVSKLKTLEKRVDALQATAPPR